VDWVNSAGETHTLPCEAIWVQLGLSPQLGPLSEWGLAMQRKQLVVDSASFATSVPGIFAVGDVNTYPGKQKLILCGFHEATLAAFAIAARMRPGERTTLQYTTTSTHLHRLLGVDGR
jgi:thioredoxin reductase (NADPH)